MVIKYTKHLRRRLQLRRLEHRLPERIYSESGERYYDTLSQHDIAVLKMDIGGVEKEMMVAYNENEEKGEATIITCHPLKPMQKRNRILSGRWRKL